MDALWNCTVGRKLLFFEGSLAQSCSTSHLAMSRSSKPCMVRLLLTRIYLVLFRNKGRDYRAWVVAIGVKYVWLPV